MDLGKMINLMMINLMIEGGILQVNYLVLKDHNKESH